ncbi:MAG: hypothetical protein QXR19_17840 [Candidatus Jordarchaeaceae archaeon]
MDQCCVTNPKAILDQIMEKEIDTLVCSSSGCHAVLERNIRNENKVKMKFLTQILLESLG